MPDVIFRRIGGRIVPIRQEHRELAKGTVAIAGGAALASATGRYTSRIMHESANVENLAHTYTKHARAMQFKAKQLGPLFQEAYEKKFVHAGEMAIRNAVLSKKIEKQAFRVRAAGTAGAAALFLYGGRKLMNYTKLKESTKNEAIATGAAGTAAVFAVRSSYLRGVGHRGLSILKGALRRVIVKV